MTSARLVLGGAFGLLASAAHAAPPSLTFYPIPRVSNSNTVQVVPSTVDEFVVESDTSGAATGTPHPISQTYPLPVAIVNGGSGSGSGTGGTVTQGPAASSASGNTWYTGDVVLDGLVSGGKLPVSVTFPATQAVSGTVAVSSLPALPAGSNAIGSVSVSNFPATQPVSATSLPLPTGAATSANQTPPLAPGASGATLAEPIQGVSGGVAVPVSGSLTPVPYASQPVPFSATFATTAATALAAGSYHRISFQAQGSGNGCYSFANQSSYPLSVSGSTCTNGYPISASLSYSSPPQTVPNSALTIIGPATLSLVGDTQ